MSEYEINKRIAERIQHYLDVRSLTQGDLAEYMGVTQATVSNWCNGVKMPRMNKIDKICEFFEVTRSDLMDPEPEPGSNQIAEFPTIPILGYVAAGESIFMSDHEVERMPVKHEYGKDVFGLYIYGDSMAPRIQNGDIVIVRKQSTVDDGEIAIVAVNGDEATCKRVYRSEDSVTLIADNPTVYPPHTYGPQDEPITILGKVIEVIVRI